MAVEAIKLGAYDFVEKPFTIDTLLDQLKGAMNAQSRREQNGGLGDIDLSHIGGAVLTPREREVLREIATGASSKEAGPSSASARARSRCIGPASWTSSARATRPISCASFSPTAAETRAVDNGVAIRALSAR